MEIDDIAPLKKIRLRIDGSGSRPDWFLDKVLMRNLNTEEVSVFTYEEWLSRTCGPKKTMICEMPAMVDEEVMVELTTYIIQVKTSDVSGKFQNLPGSFKTLHKQRQREAGGVALVHLKFL
ncbi:hypothetical protein GOODEAATRI_030646 [Goodea atripinnis]|uniref:PLAT domain-containing protein n=1 Tax=Goodea atripinnis TaxID=208336 RepID=A0ABV0NHG1_9TELE